MTSVQKKKTQINIGDHILVSQSAEGWLAELPLLELRGTGATKEEARMDLFSKLGEKLQSGGAAVAAVWDDFCQSNTTEIEMTDEEIAEEAQGREHASRLAAGEIKGLSPLTKDNFDQAVASETPTLVDFWAAWCRPCLAMVPVVEEVAGRLSGKVDFACVDVEKETEMYDRLEFRSIPTMILFRAGVELGRIVGSRPAAQLEAEISSLLETSGRS